MGRFKYIFFVIIFASIYCYSQDCSKNHEWVECTNSYNDKYQLYMQPRKNSIDINDNMSYKIVFDKGKDFIISVCADSKYYPLNVKLLNPETGAVLYDNASDGYNEIFSMRFYSTQNILLMATLMADKHGKDRPKSEEKVCIGLMLQWKDIVQKKQQKKAR